MIFRNNAQSNLNQSDSSYHVIHEIQLPQQKSKLIQDAYERANDEERDCIFKMEISENIIRFCQDKYQHYIIICVIEKGSLSHKRLICTLVNQNLHLFFSRKYAYKIVQSCICQSDIQPETGLMIKYMIDNIKKLQFQQYGSLIIGTLLECPHYWKLHSQLISLLQIDKLKYQQYGCVLVIKIATKMNNVDEIVKQLTIQSIQLTTSEFSNYIIQKMLTDRTIEQNKILINDYLIPNFLEIACNKFGSNVCETMLLKSLAYQLMNLWNLVIKFHLKELVNNEFANYVMQTYYFYIQQFSYIAEDFVHQLMQLNKKHQLNKNGRIVYSKIMQPN